MSVTPSSSSNVSLPPPPHLPSFISIYHEIHSCQNSTVGVFSTTAFTVTSLLLLLPLYIFIIYLGLQRWRRQRFNTPTSHSDVFAFHMVVMELMSVLGFTVICCGIYSDQPQLMMVGIHLSCLNITGQACFHILTCAERYLAVVHPVTYRNLRSQKGIRIRDITIGCVWLWCFVASGHLHLQDRVIVIIFYICANTLTVTIVSFWSLSVLCVLIHPGPGEGGGGRQQADQSKLRAFYTIVVILGVLLMRFGVGAVNSALYASLQLWETLKCIGWLSLPWICLPSSLLLPLLFLQRAGKLSCCKSNR